MENLIELCNVTKKFKNETVLNNINVSFEKGKIHGIIGRNGSGKTVLFKCIAGFLSVSDGSIKVNNIEIGKDCDFIQDCGIIIENTDFIEMYSGKRNLYLLASILNKVGREEINNVMIKVGLDHNSKKMVKKYSLGMKQRLSIAQAIMENPSILILDEPMNGLDNDGVIKIRNLLLSLKSEGKTILLASHSSDDIKYLCDTVHLIDNGILSEV